MPYRVRVFECAGCGQQVERRAGAEAKVRCIRCGIARSAENAVQLHNHRGPLYQRWMQGVAAAVAREQQWAALAAQLDDLGMEDTG